MAEYTGLDWNFSPAKKFKTFFCNNDLKHLLCLISFKFILWEEEHSYTIISFLTKFYSKRLNSFFEEFMRNLKKDTNTITSLSLCIFTCTMLKFFYYIKCTRYSVMCLISLDIYNSTNTTVIMFKSWIIKTSFFMVYCF